MNKTRNNTCCFTGHRPERLTIEEAKIREWLETQIRDVISQGYLYFISGMQRGVDIYAAETVLKLKCEGLPVKLICACAWNGMEQQWEQSWRDKYYAIIDTADEVCYISKKPGRKAFFERDCWMVDNASMLIAVFNNLPGGTKHTIDYAKKKGLKIKVIE